MRSVAGFADNLHPACFLEGPRAGLSSLETAPYVYNTHAIACAQPPNLKRRQNFLPGDISRGRLASGVI